MLWPRTKIKTHYILRRSNTQNIYLYGYATCKLFPTGGFKWVDPKELDLNKYTSVVRKIVSPEADLEYPKELRTLYNAYPLAPDKIQIKEKSREVIFLSVMLKTWCLSV